MRWMILAFAGILAAGCSCCKPPQAVQSKRELDTTVATVLKALPSLPEVEFRTQFKRKVDEIFKVTPGVDALDIMLYRICVIREQNKERITVQQAVAMETQAYETWLKYVQGLEKVALERVKAGLDSQPLGPPEITTSAVVPDILQARVRQAAMRAVELGAKPDATP